MTTTIIDKPVQDALWPDGERMPVILAGLLGKANRIADAGADFLAAADKLLAKDDGPWAGRRKPSSTRRSKPVRPSRLERDAPGSSNTPAASRDHPPRKCTRLTDRRPYQARCRTCGPLGPASSLDQALDACRRHRQQHPGHQVGRYRISIRRETRQP